MPNYYPQEHLPDLMSGENASDTSDTEPPGFIVPGIRCGLEMLLVGALLLYVGLPATNTIYLGMVVVLAVVSMTVVLFWSLNRQMEAWIAWARQPRQAQ
ncbi:MAG: hypothetical protein V5A39_09230 [Haloarculaceae archaeon]